MTRRRFGYIVDHPKRDLPGAISFARAAAQRGCDTYVIPNYEQASDVPLLPLDALIVNFARPTNLELVKAYYEAGLPIYVLDTEGGTLTEAGTNTPDRLAKLLKERGFSKYLSGYFFWGSRLRESFIEHSGMTEESLIVTGCPRFDYASTRWRAALTYPQKDYVLVNASYPLVNPLFVRSESRERATAVATGWDSDYLKGLADDVTVAFHSFQEAIAQLAADLPNLQFLVRPHPFENPAPYQQRFRELPNVTVDGSGGVLTVIANSRCVVHLNCQTAVEATMLDKLPISIEYLNTARMLGHAPLPSRASAHAQSYEQLRDMVAHTDVHANSFPFARNYRELVYPWFHENDGQAGDRVTEQLVARVPPRAQPISVARSLAASRSHPRIGQRIQSLAINILGSFAVARLRALAQPVRQNKMISIREVATELEVLCKLDNAPTPTVSRARHPITGLPLASIVCKAG